jgi:hypothetical protein
MKTVLIEHGRRYPYWTIDDLYKLIHQSSMGSEHALGNEDRIRNYLRTELNSLVPGPDEPLLDPISPDGKIVRIHLRPFSMLHLDAESLLQAFILTAKIVTPSINQLIEHAGFARSLAENGCLSFDADEISRYLQRLQSSGFPAVHHSQMFENKYVPAYRVVARDLIPDEILLSANR